MKTLFFEGYAKEDKNSLIYRIQKTVTENSCWIVDFKHYSNKTTTFTIEAEASNLMKLMEDLINLNIRLIPENYIQEINEIQKNVREQNTDITIILTLNFIQNLPDFRKEWTSPPGK